MRPRERFLTDAELRRLGAALTALEAEGRLPVHAAAALRLLILTGCRRNEIVSLRWEDVRLEDAEIGLRDSKTGPRTVSLSPAAVALLAALPRLAGNPWVIPGCRPGARMTNIYGHWRRVRTRAEPRRRAHSRPAALLCVPRARAGREPAGDREAARPRPHTEHRALRAPDAGVGAGGGGTGRRRHRRGHPAAPAEAPPRPGAVRTGGRGGGRTARVRLAAGVGGSSRHRRPASPPRSGRTSCRRASAVLRPCRSGASRAASSRETNSALAIAARMWRACTAACVMAGGYRRVCCETAAMGTGVLEDRSVSMERRHDTQSMPVAGRRSLLQGMAPGAPQGDAMTMDTARLVLVNSRPQSTNEASRRGLFISVRWPRFCA